VQEFIKGEEYVVNTVSYKGIHKITDVWHKHKDNIGGIALNDFAEIISPMNSAYSAIANYLPEVLDALGIVYGAGHTEIMIVDGKALLIETAARLEGSIDPSAVNETVGHNHVSRLMDIYLRPDLLSLIESRYKIKKYARHVFLRSFTGGNVIHTPDTKDIVKLDSFHSMSLSLDKGDILLKTTSLVDFPGFVYLVSEDKNKVIEDYNQLREYEQIMYIKMCGAAK
jgi:hypothetical protein